MVWACIVFNCGVGELKNPQKLSAFSIPKNVEARKEWGKQLSRDLENFSKSSRVCEKHFDDQDVLKGDHKVFYNGEVMTSVPRQKVSLKKGALPKLNPVKNSNSSIVYDKVQINNNQQFQEPTFNTKIKKEENSIFQNENASLLDSSEEIKNEEILILQKEKPTLLDSTAEVARKKETLKKGALPLRSNNNVNHNTVEVPKTTAEVPKTTVCKNEHILEPTCTKENNIVIQEENLNAMGSINEVLSPKLIENPRKLQNDQQATDDIFNDHEYCFKNTKNVINEYLNLKSNILNGVLNVELPDSYCSAYYNNNSNTVLYNFYNPDDNYNNGTRAPFPEKIVQLQDKQLVVWIGERRGLFDYIRNPCSPAELESILATVSKKIVCPGGPLISRYPDIYTECSFKDKDVWRHNKCCIVLQGKGTCIWCHGLFRRFEDSKSKNSTKKRQRTIALTPSSRKATKAVQKMCHAKQRQLVAKGAQIKRMLEEIHTLKEQVKDKAPDVVNKKMKKKLNVSEI